MKKNIIQRDIEIICEIHPQHIGSIKEIERMIIQSKLSGADYVRFNFIQAQNYLVIMKENIWK